MGTREHFDQDIRALVYPISIRRRCEGKVDSMGVDSNVCPLLSSAAPLALLGTLL